jgi:MoaA/NifB/PqqE/SkfB family radical SAM enzyme
MLVLIRCTTHCNLRCPFCAYDRTLPGPRTHAEPARIAAFARALALHAAAAGERVHVSWIGGEPLLWPPLVEVDRELHGTLGLSLGVTTNGTALASEAVREHLLASYSEVTVSIDAPDAAHDALRGWPGGSARLARDVRRLADEKRSRGRGPLLRCNAVLMRDTIGRFEELCAELARIGIEEVTFNQLGGNDRPAFHAVHRLGPEQVAAFAAGFEGLCARLAERGLRLRGDARYLARLSASSRGDEVPGDLCRPGETFLFVDELGRVAPCSFTLDECGVPIDEIRSAEDLRALPARFRALRGERRPRPCADCLSTQLTGKFAAPRR